LKYRGIIIIIVISQKPQDRLAERNKKNKGQRSTEDKRKVTGEKDAWTISTYLR
jgi:hypothetical protein